MNDRQGWIRNGWIGVVGGVITLVFKSPIAGALEIDVSAVETAAAVALLFGIYKILGYSIR